MMRKWYAGMFIACCASSALALPSSPRLSQRPFFYSTNGSSVADALTALSRTVHVPVRIEDEAPVQGHLAGRYEMQPEQFLDVLAASFGLIWYYDGAVIHVEPASARASVAIQLNYAVAADVEARLERDAVENARMPISVNAKRNTLTVSGPSSYVDRVSDAVRQIEDDARARVDTVVRAVPLKFENAADRMLALAGQTVTAPGLAARLQQRVRGTEREDASASSASSASARTPAPKRLQFDVPLPIFEADARTNAVLVRDRPERIDADRQLIMRFDSKPRAISIRAYVFDVDADAFAALDLNPPDSESGGAPATHMLLHDGATALLAQLHALRQTGKARVCIDRDLVTVDHAPVSIDCREFESIQQDDAGQGSDDKKSRRMGQVGTSIAIEPDLSGKGSASLFQLVTTFSDVRGACPSADGANAVERDRPVKQHGDQPTASTVRTTLARGDALVFFDERAKSGRSPDARQRLVVLVPTPIDD
jgi:type II secretory pathway component GspD/PulD (secretin)